MTTHLLRQALHGAIDAEKQAVIAESRLAELQAGRPGTGSLATGSATLGHPRMGGWHGTTKTKTRRVGL